MRAYSPGFVSALQTAPQTGLAPVYFLYIEPRDPDTGDAVPFGFWTGREDVTVTVARPDGATATRTYLGRRGLRVGARTYVADLTDQKVSVSLSQIATEPQQVIRQYRAQQAYCEIHATTMAKGVMASDPQLEWIGILDKSSLRRPQAGGEGAITFDIRSELMWQLGRSNPARSSHEHQLRRSGTDAFCNHATKAAQYKVQWG